MNIEEKIKKIFKLLEYVSYPLHNEKKVQKVIEDKLSKEFKVESEYRLSNKDIIDFLIDGEIGIEVKVKGQASKTLSQCERYCEHDQIKAIVLATGWSTGWPAEINNKPSYYLSLSRGSL